jgi:hypothetical protein
MFVADSPVVPYAAIDLGLSETISILQDNKIEEGVVLLLGAALNEKFGNLN